MLAGWRATTSSPRASAAARAPTSGSSTKGRRPPTAGPGSTTSGPGCSRTSTRGSTPCGASTCPARPAGTATGSRSRSRSRRSSGSPGKPEIEEFGIEAFNQRCRESVQRYVEDWSALTGRIGMWLDMSDAYWTMNNSYIESVWWLFRQMWDAQQLYEGYKVVPYCGRCGTALSSHELGQPGAYRDVTEDSVYVRFPVVGRDFDLLVWTTTPWTLVSNVAAAIGPDIDYVRVRSPEPGGRDLVMARTRVKAVLGDEAEIVGPVPVDELVGAPLRAAVRLAARRGRRLARRRRRLRDDRRRQRHRAPRAGVRRDRPRGRGGRGPPDPQPGQRRGASPTRSRASRTSSSRTPTPGSSRSSRRPAGSSGSSRTCTRTRTAGAAARR